MWNDAHLIKLECISTKFKNSGNNKKLKSYGLFDKKTIKNLLNRQIYNVSAKRKKNKKSNSEERIL